MKVIKKSAFDCPSKYWLIELIIHLLVLCLFCSVFKLWYVYVTKQLHDTENFIATVLMGKKFPTLMQPVL
jgi:hypothetical protein